MSFRRTILLLAIALLTVSAPPAPGQQSTTQTSLPPATVSQLSFTTEPDAVEEDWVLVVANPDPVGVGPQITTVMSPDASDPSRFAAFDLDYREYPNFAPGGLQVQVWSAGQVTNTSTEGNALFNTPGEQVSWTQRMSLSGNLLTYDITNGASTTWGQFGQGEHLQVSYTTTASSLGGYDPNVSVNRSGVSWEQNYVTSLTLAQVRYYANGQLIWTDSNPKILVDNSVGP